MEGSELILKITVPDRKTITFAAKRFDTVGSIKDKISTEENIPQDQQMLKPIAGKPYHCMHNGHYISLYKYDWKDNVLDLELTKLEGEFNVCVRKRWGIRDDDDDEVNIVKIDKSATTTVGELKDQVCNQLGIDPGSRMAVDNGVVSLSDDSRTLDNYRNLTLFQKQLQLKVSHVHILPNGVHVCNVQICHEFDLDTTNQYNCYLKIQYNAAAEELYSLVAEKCCPGVSVEHIELANTHVIPNNDMLLYKLPLFILPIYLLMH